MELGWEINPPGRLGQGEACDSSNIFGIVSQCFVGVGRAEVGRDPMGDPPGPLTFA